MSLRDQIFICLLWVLVYIIAIGGLGVLLQWLDHS